MFEFSANSKYLRQILDSKVDSLPTDRHSLESMYISIEGDKVTTYTELKPQRVRQSAPLRRSKSKRNNYDTDMGAYIPENSGKSVEILASTPIKQNNRVRTNNRLTGLQAIAHHNERYYPYLYMRVLNENYVNSGKTDSRVYLHIPDSRPITVGYLDTNGDEIYSHITKDNLSMDVLTKFLTWLHRPSYQVIGKLSPVNDKYMKYIEGVDCLESDIMRLELFDRRLAYTVTDCHLKDSSIEPQRIADNLELCEKYRLSTGNEWYRNIYLYQSDNSNTILVYRRQLEVKQFFKDWINTYPLTSDCERIKPKHHRHEARKFSRSDRNRRKSKRYSRGKR